MSHIREGALEDLQNLLPWPLWADPFFADIAVFDYRKADIESEIAKSLAVFTETGGKCGAAVVAMPLAAQVPFRDATSSHPLRAEITYRIYTSPVINDNPATGTLKTARMIGSRIRRVMQHYIIEGFATPLVPDEDRFLIPVEVSPEMEVYEVMFHCFELVQQHLFKVAMPRLIYDDVTGQLEILCDTPDVTIYYTLDGSFPFTSAAHPNAAAQVYAGPLTMEGEWFIMVAAVKENHFISDVRALRSHQISSQAGDGASLGAIS